MKDWTGNNTSALMGHAPSNRSEMERADVDFYATDPKALEMLLELESFENVWECACGQGHLSEVLKRHGIHGKSSDVVNRGYGEVEDFLFFNKEWDGDIITNPPYKYATEFVYKALETVKQGRKVAMFLKINFLETKKRRALFDKFRPSVIYVSSSRLNCYANGKSESANNLIVYAWFIWEKGYTGETILRWFN